MRHAAIIGLLLPAVLFGCGRQAREANRTTAEKSAAKTKSVEPDSTVVNESDSTDVKMPGMFSADLEIPVNKGSYQLAVPKFGIERPLEKAIASDQPRPKPIPAGNQPATQLAASSDKFRNPKVEPGKVRWRKDFKTACAASHKSGKPVLLFQMIGKLDDRFC